jgi:GH15 family glucan-1,4-alpha-glucosidase
LGDELSNESHEVLIRRSVESILRSQSDNGAIIASPDFVEYRFCWLRDASFSAYALDIAGEHDASRRYHAWVNAAVSGISETIDSVIWAHQHDEALNPLDMPPARFALDGSTVVDDWPNFQIDGYGTWLWSLGEHLNLTQSKTVPDNWLKSVERVARYLSTFAFSPCWDVWEENGDAQHTSTLACVYGGLMSAGHLLGNESYFDRARQVHDHVVERASADGYFVKSSSNSDVDASTLWLTAPFGVVDANDEYFAKTVALIEDRLMLNGGIRRYPSDVYFGSGAWPVLTGSLGWHYVGVGELEGANRCRDWIEEHINEDGDLGEQFGGDEHDPLHFQEWVARWGSPAKDLAWSHAMYVVLCSAIDEFEGSITAGAEDRGSESLGEAITGA